MKIEEILEKLVRFNTVNDKENQEIMDWLGDFLNPLGFETTFIEDKKTNRKNLFARIDNGKEKTLTFAAHTDTVPPSPAWTKDPFTTTTEGDKIFGLGSCDMKGGIAAVLYLMSNLDLKSLPTNLNLLFTYGEEITLDGVKYFYENSNFDLGEIIIPEPTELIPRIASKGALAIRIKFIGKSAHASQPEKGINAIMAANYFIEKIEQYIEGIKDQTNPLFDPAQTTLNVGKISGGDAVNKVPDACTLEFGIRYIKKDQNEELVDEIKKILEKLETKNELEILLNSPAMLCDSKDFIKKIEKATNAKATGINYTTDGAFLSQKKFDSIVIGPGPNNAHQADEFVSCKSLYDSVDIFKRIILSETKKLNKRLRSTIRQQK